MEQLQIMPSISGVLMLAGSQVLPPTIKQESASSPALKVIIGLLCDDKLMHA